MIVLLRQVEKDLLSLNDIENFFDLFFLKRPYNCLANLSPTLSGRQFIFQTLQCCLKLLNRFVRLIE
jgi:hypothetical protein